MFTINGNRVITFLLHNQQHLLRVDFISIPNEDSSPIHFSTTCSDGVMPRHKCNNMVSAWYHPLFITINNHNIIFE